MKYKRYLVIISSDYPNNFIEHQFNTYKEVEKFLIQSTYSDYKSYSIFDSVLREYITKPSMSKTKSLRTSCK